MMQFKGKKMIHAERKTASAAHALDTSHTNQDQVFYKKATDLTDFKNLGSQVFKQWHSPKDNTGKTEHAKRK